MADAPSSPLPHYEMFIAVDRREGIVPIKIEAFDRMNHLTGWCSYQKAAILVDLILRSKAQRILEIGVYGGRSLVPMAVAARSVGGKVYGIDPWCEVDSLEHVENESNRNFWANVNYDEMLADLEAKIRSFGLADTVELIRTSSEEADPIGEIDLLHIDGNHSEYTSYLDVRKWVPYVKTGGWIVFDDLYWSEAGVPTTQRATQWLDEHCLRLAEFSISCGWGIWVKL